MNIVIVGAGAMGSRFGAMLFQSGYQVALVDEWKEHIQTIQTNGLEVTSEEEKHIYNIPVFLPENISGEYDLLILLTKAMDTEPMLNKCKHLIQEETNVLTLQNGLGNIDILEEFVPRERLYAGVTTFASNLTGPGRIEVLGSGDTEIMQVENKDSAGAREIANTFNKAEIHTSLSANVMKSIWKKAIFNSVLNPLCTLMNSTVATVGGYSEFNGLVEGMINEAIPVAEAEGVELEAQAVKGIILKVLDPAMSGTHISSMHQDIVKGRKTEIDYLNGAIVRKAERYGLPAPNHTLVYHLIRMLEEISNDKLAPKPFTIK